MARKRRARSRDVLGIILKGGSCSDTPLSLLSFFFGLENRDLRVDLWDGCKDGEIDGPFISLPSRASRQTAKVELR